MMICCSNPNCDCQQTAKIHIAAEAEKFTPAGNPDAPSVDMLETLTQTDAEAAIAFWNSCMTDYNGLLNAKTGNESTLFSDITETSNWEWGSEAGEYKDSAKTLSDSELLELRDAFTDCAIDLASALVTQLTENDITLESFSNQMVQQLKDLHIASYMFGRGGIHALDTDDSDEIEEITDVQISFWEKFMIALAAALLTIAQVEDRTSMYGEASTQSYEIGRAANFGLKLPAYPADGSQICLSRCRCHWRIEQDETEWRAYWTLEGGKPDGRNCATCLNNAFKWNPYTQKKVETANYKSIRILKRREAMPVEPTIQQSALTHIAASKRYQETETRAYFDGVFTSTSVDTSYRTIPATEFPAIVKGFNDGLRVLDSHKHNTQGIGKTVYAEIVGEEVHGTFYILKGYQDGDGKLVPIKLESQSYETTMDWIATLKDGMTDKCSMGWYSERDICNISGESIYSYKCPYYPGQTYPVLNEETGQEELVQATYSCYGITPVELSLVYFGANPDARLIQKAKALAEDKKLTIEQISSIESHLKVAILNENQRSLYKMPVDKETLKAIQEAVQEAVAANARENENGNGNGSGSGNGTPHAASPDDMVEIRDANGNILQRIRRSEIPAPPTPITQAALEETINTAIAPLTQQMQQIETAVRSGDTLDDREKAIDENVKQYNRIYGKEGDEDAHRAHIETFQSVEAINAHTATLKKAADTMFHAGRRTEGLGAGLEGADETSETTNNTESGTPNNPM